MDLGELGVWQLKEEYVGGDASTSLLNPSEEYVGLADMIFDNLPQKPQRNRLTLEIPGVSISCKINEGSQGLPQVIKLNKLRRDN